ncbi:hypothetical protein AB0H43_27085 [Hamadaea sp. NPDC050747]|uniref:hypothetical protein n=1 Tax=Hamadaea sp. NPDC050747 TaxID=3155789 RepID=UPI0033DC51C3
MGGRGALLGVPLGNATYQNINFGLFRILIPVDQLWDALTIQGYHVQQHVFDPVQLSGAATASVTGNVLAYKWPCQPPAGTPVTYPPPPPRPAVRRLLTRRR